MTIFRTFTDTERAALKLHGLDTHRPSQLSDAFVLGMRYAMQKAVEAVKAAGPKDGPLKLVSDGFAAAITSGVKAADAPRDTNAEWVRRLRETATHLRENSLSLAKYPDMADEARARELAALYIGEIAELHEAKRALGVLGTLKESDRG